MTFNPELHHRRSIRLRDYDYAKPGHYFVTLCTQNRECLFGSIQDNQIVLNEIGRIVHRHWLELAEKFAGIGDLPFVVMPNHVHGIIEITHSGCRGLINQTLTINNQTPTLKKKVISLGEIVRQFKAKTTLTIRNTTPIFQIWQRNYYEHIIRDQEELEKIERYISENPEKWDEDDNNPEQIQKHMQQR